jgi:hypothetical protein
VLGLLPYACIYVGESKKKLLEISHIITAVLVEASDTAVGREGL